MMDYQFAHDLLGNPFATCDFEYEALGDWLSNDLATGVEQAKALMHIVEQLLDKQITYYQHTGKIYHLVLEQEEIELFLNNNDISQPVLTDDEIEIDEIEEEEEKQGTSQPECGFGLVDFQHILREWIEFTI